MRKTVLSCYSGRAEGRHLTFMIVLICLGSLHHVARSCSQKGVSRSSPAVRGYDEDSDGHSMARHVLLIGCDGLGSLYMQNSTNFLPNLASLLASGAHTYNMRTQPPAISAPNWVSLVASLPPRDSGIYDNEWTPERSRPPNSTVEWLHPISGAGTIPEGFWKTAKLQDPLMRSAMAVSWPWLRYLCESDTCDSLTIGSGDDPDSVVTKALVEEILANKPSIMFLHLDEVDIVGHKTFWGSEEYYDAAESVDRNIGVVLEALKEANMFDETVVIMAADHGGYGNDHGDFSLSNMLVPLVFSGPCVRRNYTLTTAINSLDVAPTALGALGLRHGKFMRGESIREAFQC